MGVTLYFFTQVDAETERICSIHLLENLWRTPKWALLY